jgi:hypothetical protein
MANPSGVQNDAYRVLARSVDAGQPGDPKGERSVGRLVKVWQGRFP